MRTRKEAATIAFGEAKN